MAITKFYMPLESLKPLQESRLWFQANLSFLCTLNALDFFFLQKQNRLHVMRGSDFFFFLFVNQDKELLFGHDFKLNCLGKMKEWSMITFRNNRGLENITSIKSERQKNLSIFIYKNTWEYKKVAKQWGYRLKTWWIYWYLQFLLMKRFMLHLGEPKDSQCHVKKDKKKKKAFT